LPDTRKLAAVAGVLWLCALPFTAFVLYYHQRQVTGFEVLWLGWLAAMGGSVAWYANIFFFYALVRLLVGARHVHISSLIAAGLAADTFQFSTYPGEGPSAVYGYGIGTFLWLGSIAVLLLAAGQRRVETLGSLTGWRATWLRTVAVGLLVALPAGVVTLGIKDRIGATPEESSKLASVIFKRGAVCKQDTAPPLFTVSLLGPLELIDKHHDWAYSPFDVLRWGVPVVRWEGMDYSVSRPDGQVHIVGRKAAGPAFATLEAQSTESFSPALKTVRMALHVRQQPAMTWKAVWREEGKYTATFCPDLERFRPNATQHPRREIAQAFELPKTDAFGDSDFRVKSPEGEYRRASGVLLTQAEIAGDRWEASQGLCPAGSGIRKFPRLLLGVAYEKDGVFHFTQPGGGSSFQGAICSTHFLYLYSVSSSNFGLDLDLEKRVLNDFRRVRSQELHVGGDFSFFKSRPLTLVQLSDDKQGITAQLRATTGQVLLLRADMPAELEGAD
jgi:hypothetical protein